MQNKAKGFMFVQHQHQQSKQQSIGPVNQLKVNSKKHITIKMNLNKEAKHL